VQEGATVSIGMVGWLAGGMALAVAVVESLRLVNCARPGRSAVGADVLMALCMAIMALPVTAGVFLSGSRWSAGLFAVVSVCCLAVGLRDAMDGRWHRCGGWLHHAVGWGAMVCMALAMGTGGHSMGHGAMKAAAPSVWSIACAVLALYFWLDMTITLQRQVNSGATGGYRRVPVGRIAMAGITAVMLVMMV
jgi:hypothetical protein